MLWNTSIQLHLNIYSIINCVLKLKPHLCPQTVNELNRGNTRLVVFAPITAEGFSPMCRNGQPAGSRFHIPNSQCPIPYSNRDEHQFSSVRPLNLIKSHKMIIQFPSLRPQQNPLNHNIHFKGHLHSAWMNPGQGCRGKCHWPVLCTLHRPHISKGNFSCHFPWISLSFILPSWSTEFLFWSKQ